MTDRKLRLVLTGMGNPDRVQDPDAHIAPMEEHYIKTLEEASELCCAYIAEHNLGAGNWSCGRVFDWTGVCVARIHYNGRAEVLKTYDAYIEGDEYVVPKGNWRGKEVEDNLIKFTTTDDGIPLAMYEPKFCIKVMDKFECIANHDPIAAAVIAAAIIEGDFGAT